MCVVEAPCKDCTKRQLHCHSSCEAYREYRRYREQVYAEKMKRADESDFMRAVKRKAALISIRTQLSDKRRRR